MKPIYLPLTANITEDERKAAGDKSGAVPLPRCWPGYTVTQTCSSSGQPLSALLDHTSSPTVDDELVAELEKIIADLPPRMPYKPHASCAPSVLLDQTSLAQSAGWNPQLKRVDLPPAFPVSLADAQAMSECKDLDDLGNQIRAKNWERMAADLPSAVNLTDRGCKLANYIARQERRRNWTLTKNRKVNREGEEGSQE